MRIELRLTVILDVRSSSVYPTPDSTRKRARVHSRRHSFALKGRVQVLEHENCELTSTARYSAYLYS
jgi:hypothetical protein